MVNVPTSPPSMAASKLMCRCDQSAWQSTQTLFHQSFWRLIKYIKIVQHIVTYVDVDGGTPGTYTHARAEKRVICAGAIDAAPRCRSHLTAPYSYFVLCPLVSQGSQIKLNGVHFSKFSLVNNFHAIIIIQIGRCCLPCNYKKYFQF